MALRRLSPVSAPYRDDLKRRREPPPAHKPGKRLLRLKGGPRPARGRP